MKKYLVWYRSCFDSLDSQIIQAVSEDDLYRIFGDRIVSFEVIT